VQDLIRHIRGMADEAAEASIAKGLTERERGYRRGMAQGLNVALFAVEEYARGEVPLADVVTDLFRRGPTGGECEPTTVVKGGE